MDELNTYLEKFEKMLKSIPDEQRYAYEFLTFFRELLRLKTNRLIPAIEIGAILKHEKPIIFYELKKLSDYNQAIHFITNANVEYESARKTIDTIINNKNGFVSKD